MRSGLEDFEEIFAQDTSYRACQRVWIKKKQDERRWGHTSFGVSLDHGIQSPSIDEKSWWSCANSECCGSMNQGQVFEKNSQEALIEIRT